MPQVVGEQPCPGEAHENPYIDNCMVCLKHRWEFVPKYAPIDVVAACAKGEAVGVFGLPMETREEYEAKGLRLMSVTEKLRGGATLVGTGVRRSSSGISRSSSVRPSPSPGRARTTRSVASGEIRCEGRSSWRASTARRRRSFDRWG